MFLDKMVIVAPVSTRTSMCFPQICPLMKGALSCGDIRATTSSVGKSEEEVSSFVLGQTNFLTVPRPFWTVSSSFPVVLV